MRSELEEPLALNLPQSENAINGNQVAQNTNYRKHIPNGWDAQLTASDGT